MDDGHNAQHQRTERIRCPIHGFIRYSPAERQIIDDPAFQRLRHIKQLAFTYYLYPGATHTRFEHSLGVMELATRAFDVLCSKRPDILKKEFRQVPELAKDPLGRARQILRLAALFHDIGHMPFSHAGEIEGLQHEQQARTILRSRFERRLEKRFFPGCAKLVKEVLSGETDGGPTPSYLLHRLLKGELDVDRTDYLLRDSHHCGVEYGQFDHARLIESLNVVQNAQGVLDLCIERDGYHTAEALLLARYQMNTQVYFHRVRRIYDLYLGRFLDAWINQTKECSASDFAGMDDTLVFDAIRKHASDPKSPAHLWAKRILDRDHHRVVFESSEHADADEIDRCKLALERAGRQNRDLDLLSDDAFGHVHRLWVPEERDVEQDLRVLDRRSGTNEPIARLSKVIAKIPKWFRVFRIYAHPRRSGVSDQNFRERLNELSDWFRKEVGGGANP